MNPRIHHPLWYQMNGLVDAKEMAFAVGRPDMICTPPMAQFVTRSFVIACQQERWEIRTEHPDLVDRIRQITEKVFGILGETHVGAYGFNFNYQRSTGCGDVGRRLSKAVRAAGIGFADAEGVGSLKHVSKEGVCQTTVVVESSPREKSIAAVGFNMHYDISELVQGPIRFELGELIALHFPEAHKAATEQCQQIVEQLGEEEDDSGSSN